MHRTCFDGLDALAGPLERVEFEGASQRLISVGLIQGDRIQGYLAKPEGAGPFPAVIGLHGCAGMSETTKRKLVDELVGWGYVVLLVDSFATRRVDHDCFRGYFGHRPHVGCFGALAFLAGQTFVDPQRVAAVGFSKGAWVCPLGVRKQLFVQAVRPSRQFEISCRGCVQSSVQGRRGASLDTDAHSDWGPRRMDAGGRLLRENRRLGDWRSADRSGRLSRRSPRVLLPGAPAGEDDVWSLVGIQRGGSHRCEPQDAGISQAPPKLRLAQL